MDNATQVQPHATRGDSHDAGHAQRGTATPNLRLDGHTLQIPACQWGFDDLTSPQAFPPFVLLGRRNDTSFSRSGDKVVIEYEWAEHSPQGPVARLTVEAGGAAFVEEEWQGSSHGASRSAEGLGRALQSRALVQAHADVIFDKLVVTPESEPGPDGRLRLRDATREQGTLNPPDERQAYFAALLWSRYGVVCTQAEEDSLHPAEVPCGALRALVVPHRRAEVQKLRALLAEYLERPDSYSVPWLPPRLAKGSFSHREASVTWVQDPSSVERPRVEQFELRMFVGPWRAAVELVEHLARSWDFTARDRPPAVLCYPEQLVRSLEFGVPDGGTVRVPPLLPPQEAFGVERHTAGDTPEPDPSAPFAKPAELTLRPRPLGRWARRFGGSAEALSQLRAALDEVLPRHPVGQSGWETFMMGNWRAPVVSLSRVHGAVASGHTVPVLFIRLRGSSDPFSLLEWPPVHQLTRGALPLCLVGRAQACPFLIAPNLPFLNRCHDEEGFFYLLPELIQHVESQEQHAWIVEHCSMSATHLQKPQVIERTGAGPRFEGW